MAIKPILFNTEMVKAILDGRKTQTRRVAFKHDDLREFESNDYPDGWWYLGRVFKYVDDFLRYPQSPRCRYAPGDILWVRETFLRCFMTKFLYKADDSDGAIERAFIQQGWNWIPSIHMPREAARIFLRVTDVRVERLQEINEEQAKAEGAPRAFEYRTPEGPLVTLDEDGYYVLGFKAVWDSTVKKADLPLYGWIANPWVWVIEFERCGKPEGWCT